MSNSTKPEPLATATADILAFRLGIAAGLGLLDIEVGRDNADTLQRSIVEKSPALLQLVRERMIRWAGRNDELAGVFNGKWGAECH